MQLKAEEISFSTDNKVNSIKLTNPNLRLRILPLFSGKVHINTFKAFNITTSLSLSKAIELADVLKVSMDVLFQDNRLQQEESDIAEAAFLLQGCNSYEKEVIVDTIFALKSAMREHKRK